MARKPKPKPQPEASKGFDDSMAFDTDDGGDDPGIPEPDVPEPPPQSKSRDWRDVERYKELRSLRRLVGDDLDMDIDLD